MSQSIIGICGSLRKASVNQVVLNAAADYLQQQGARYQQGHFDQFPVYNQDIQNQGTPEAVVELGEQIAAADGIVIASPEYNYSIPGALKNALDWLSRLEHHGFAGKPLAIISASPGGGGGARMQMHLRQVLVFLDAHVINKPEIIIGGVGQKIQNGQLDDDTTTKFLHQQMDVLLQATA